MTTEELRVEIEKYVSLLYRELLLRPQLFVTRPVTAESFVMAIECILDSLSAEPRRESYLSYLGERRFGMHLFLSAFEVRNSCRLTMVEQHRPAEAQPPDLDSEYIAAFKEHLREFIAWRESQLEEGKKGKAKRGHT